MQPTCGCCRYWDSNVNLPSYGLCRRNAPAAGLVNPLEGTNSVDAVWPRTSEADWCGKWTARERE